MLIARGIILNETTPIAFKRQTNKLSIFFKSIELSHLISTPTNFSIGVRIRTSLGYISPIERFEHVEVFPIIQLPPSTTSPVHSEHATNSHKTKWIISTVINILLISIAVLSVVYYYLNKKSSENYAIENGIIMTTRTSDICDTNDGHSGKFTDTTSVNQIADNYPLIKQSNDVNDNRRTNI